MANRNSELKIERKERMKVNGYLMKRRMEKKMNEQTQMVCNEQGEQTICEEHA